MDAKVGFFQCILLIAVFWGNGCTNNPQISLANIESVSPDIIEPQDILEISGNGFVEGPATVTLKGEIDPVGLVKPIKKSIVLSAAAISDSRVRVVVDKITMEKIAKEAADFRGTIHVSFPSALKDSPIKIEAESKPVALEFRPSGGSVQITAKRVRESEHIMGLLGLTLYTGDNPEELLVSQVEPYGIADRNGIYKGARLLAVDGIPLATPSDLAGLVTAEEHRFEFVSDQGHSQTLVVRLSQTDPLANDEFVAVLLTSVALGLFLAFTLPSYRRRSYVPRIKSPNPLGKAFGLAAVSAAMVVFPGLAMVWNWDMVATLILAGIGVIGLGMAALYSREALLSRVFSFFVYGAPVFAVIVMGGVASNSFGLLDVVISQGASQWGLHVWRNPFMMAAVIVAISLLWPSKLVGDNPSPFITIISWILCLTGTITTVAFCLGGWLIPGIQVTGIPEPGIGMVLGLAVFGIKSWIVIIAARAMAGADKLERRHIRSGYLKVWIRSVLLIGLSGTAMLMEWTEIPGDLRFAAQIVSAGVFFTLFSLFICMQISRFMPESV